MEYIWGRKKSEYGQTYKLVNYNFKRNIMQKNQIKLFIIALLLLVSFIYFTPLSLFFKYSVVTSMVEGFVIAFSIFLSILNISSFYELSEIDEIEKSKNLSSILIPFISFVISGVIIFNSINYRLDSKIENEGIFTKALIVDGQQIIYESLRRGQSSEFNVLVSFNDTVSKKDFKVMTEINRDVFNLIYKDQSIEIKYLKSDPTIFKLMVGDENVKKFKKIENRNLGISDIEFLLNNKDLNKSVEYLNSLSNGWIQNKDENGIIFSNELKKETIGISKDNRLYYEGANIDLIITNSNLKEISSKNGSENDEKGVMKSKIVKFSCNNLIITLIDKLVVNPTPKAEKYLIFEKKL